MFSYEKSSISEEEFLYNLNLINDKDTEKLVELFRFILQSASQSNRKILYFYEHDNTVKSFRFIIEDTYMENAQEKLKALQNFVANLNLDIYIRQRDHRCSNYSVELFYYPDSPKKTRLAVDNWIGNIQLADTVYSFAYIKHHKMFMYGDLQPYMDYNKRCFPMSIKYLFGIFDVSSFDMLRVILLWYSHYWIVFKDILTDYQNGCTTMPSFSFADIMAAHNRRELLEIKLKKIVTRKKDNAIPLLQSYYIHKAKKYINEKDLPIIYQLPFDIFLKLICPGTENEKVKYLFQSYYRNVLYNDIPNEAYIINDYVDMCIELKEKISLRMSYNKLKSEHNRLVLLYDSRKVKQFKIPDTTLSKLELPKEYVRITNKGGLLQEAVIQHHCVASYAEKINKGKCLIYTTIYQGKRYTIEIVFNRKKFVARQIRGVYNSLPPDNFTKELKKLLRDETIRITKRKKQTNNITDFTGININNN